jgi:hypothetical protein
MLGFLSSFVPNGFTNMFPIAPHFVPCALPNVVLLKLIYSCGPIIGTPMFLCLNEYFYIGGVSKL